MLPKQGGEVDLGRWVMEPDLVGSYLDATGDGSDIYRELNMVPPMALVAIAIGALLRKLGLPPGTVHAAQELECVRGVRQGEEVTCIASLSRPARREAWSILSASLTLYAADGERLLGGRSTVLVPVNEADGG